MTKSKLNNQPEPITVPQLLKPNDAAKTLGIGLRTLWRLKANGQLPFVQIGKRVLFAVADLAAFIASNRHECRATV